MRKYLKIELRRLVKSPALYIALAIGCVITVSHVIQFAIDKTKANELELFLENAFWYPHSVFNSIMGLSSFDWQTTAFIAIAPLLAAIPFGNSYFIDIKSGYIKNLYTRAKKSDYLKAKYMSTFISGVMVIGVPMLVNLMLCMMLVPILTPISGSGLFPVLDGSMWVDLYYAHPFIYLFGFILINSLFGGLYACLTLAGSYIIGNKFLVQLFPYIIITIGEMFLSVLNLNRFSPSILLNMSQPTPIQGIHLVIAFIVLFLMTWSYYWKGLKSDAL